MDDKRAMTWQEFVDSDFDGRAYEFPDFEGTCFATIACKRWNKSRNLLVYLDLDDGRKLLTAAWNRLLRPCGYARWNTSQSHFQNRRIGEIVPPGSGTTLIMGRTVLS